MSPDLFTFLLTKINEGINMGYIVLTVVSDPGGRPVYGAALKTENFRIAMQAYVQYLDIGSETEMIHSDTQNVLFNSRLDDLRLN